MIDSFHKSFLQKKNYRSHENQSTIKQSMN